MRIPARRGAAPVSSHAPLASSARSILGGVTRFLAICVAVVALLAGCGGSSGDRGAEKELTVPAYGPFPARTVPVRAGTAAVCRAKAEAFSRAAEAFLRPFPSDADNYRVLARVQFTAFQAYRCDTSLLREALVRRLTPRQLQEVLSFFGFMGETGRRLARAPGY